MTVLLDDGRPGSVRPRRYHGAAQGEADHRIANSLQLLSALLSAQGRAVCDPIARAALDVSVHRIGAIAGVHRQLYASSGASGIEMSAYLVDLLARLQASFSCDHRHRKIHLEAEPAMTASDFAGGLGIIVTELVINACKYAYATDEQGDIEVVWTTDRFRHFSLEVRDYGRGRGTPQDADDGLGSRIVELMSRKLGADGHYVPTSTGTRFLMTGDLALP